MNQTEAESVNGLAKPTIEAMKLIVGNVERACPQCKGTGYFPVSYRVSGDCSKCKGTGRGLWKWEPEPGEWVITPCVLNENEPVLIISVDKIGFHYAIEDDEDFCSVQTYNRCIPILPWKTIERVLKDSYADTIFTTQSHRETNHYQCKIWYKDNIAVEGFGNSRQEAVMRSVIQLGKEIDAKSK